MKSAQQIKDELHQLIESINDEHTLNVLNEDIVPMIIENRNAGNQDEDLSAEQISQLDEAIRQADAGETVSWDDFLKATDRWRTK